MSDAGSTVINPELSIAVLISTIAFPALHVFWRRLLSTPPKAVTSGEIVVMTITGSGAPQAACLVLWPIWPGMLTAVTDMPLLLLPTGVISLVVSVGTIFDWK